MATADLILADPADLPTISVLAVREVEAAASVLAVRVVRAADLAVLRNRE